MAISPIPRWFVTADGVAAPGAKLITTLSGTSTPTPVYSDAALLSPRTNPVVADSAGVLPVCFLDPAITYRFVVTDADDVTIFPAMDGISVA